MDWETTAPSMSFRTAEGRLFHKVAKEVGIDGPTSRLEGGVRQRDVGTERDKRGKRGPGGDSSRHGGGPKAAVTGGSASEEAAGAVPSSRRAGDAVSGSGSSGDGALAGGEHGER